MGQTWANDLSKTKSSWRALGVIAFCLAHIPLAILESQVSMLSTIHALAVFSLGMWWALTTPDRALRIAYVGAYITGAEVLWRMTDSQVFWVSASMQLPLSSVSDRRSGRLKAQPSCWFIFTLLLPSIAVSVLHLGSSAKDISALICPGPLAMTVAAWFFSRHNCLLSRSRNLSGGRAPHRRDCRYSFYSFQTRVVVTR